MVPNSWNIFDETLFVGREAKVREIVDWANAPTQKKRVLCLVDVPGTGKTWLMQAAHTRLKRSSVASDNSSSGRLVLWIDVPRWFEPQARTFSAEPKTFFADAYAQASLLCPDFGGLDTKASLMGITDQFANDLEEHCDFRFAPLIFVDGYDEINEAQRSILDDQILERLIGNRSLRMVIAYRDGMALHSFLLRTEQAFFEKKPPAIELAVAREQFAKFKERFYPNATHLTERNVGAWIDTFPNYTWERFYINTYLFWCALKHTDPIPALDQLVTAAELKECFVALIERRDRPPSGIPPVSDAVFHTLYQIATRFAAEWSTGELRDELDMGIDDERIERLFQYGVLESSKQRYRIVSGVRELMLDYVSKGGI